MKVLVTGGAGFIGSWLVRLLLQQGFHVVNLDLLTYAGNLENLSDIAHHPAYQFVHGDIRDAKLVNKLMATVDGCIHAAAETHVDRSITHPGVFVETNILGTQNLLDAAKTHAIEKFVLVSTDEVYGSLPLNTPEQFTETSPLKPNSPYAASKAGADLLASSYFETYHLPVCITRCGNNYGPYQYPEKLIPFFILNALEDKPLPVYGDGQNVRDWIFVADHAQAIIEVFKNGRSGETYNIGADNQRHNLDITHTLLGLLHKPDSLIQFVKDRPAHDRRYALDAQKIHSELHWEPNHSFESAMQKTVTWYQENSDWIRRIQQRQAEEKTAPGAQWLVAGS
jgi:dTDP-glucose 4,6-dehydratase